MTLETQPALIKVDMVLFIYPSSKHFIGTSVSFEKVDMTIFNPASLENVDRDLNLPSFEKVDMNVLLSPLLYSLHMTLESQTAFNRWT